MRKLSLSYADIANANREYHAFFHGERFVYLCHELLHKLQSGARNWRPSCCGYCACIRPARWWGATMGVLSVSQRDVSPLRGSANAREYLR